MADNIGMWQVTFCFLIEVFLMSLRILRGKIVEYYISNRFMRGNDEKSVDGIVDLIY